MKLRYEFLKLVVIGMLIINVMTILICWSLVHKHNQTTTDMYKAVGDHAVAAALLTARVKTLEEATDGP